MVFSAFLGVKNFIGSSLLGVYMIYYLLTYFLCFTLKCKNFCRSPLALYEAQHHPYIRAGLLRGCQWGVCWGVLQHTPLRAMPRTTRLTTLTPDFTNVILVFIICMLTFGLLFPLMGQKLKYFHSQVNITSLCLREWYRKSLLV